ncbi:MAG TPA: O-antigen ligase family protein [Gaiella sp.]|uniref:O-antigen ligase family protein n=1 Tax=Gaiella sp. TaxID=2663207 RepID=UPI002D7F988C|nr:O-antigen ligase family protein [Gaiella sp.]HET9287469.1 O-antigen ligase family protein [Gaiella sp.]
MPVLERVLVVGVPAAILAALAWSSGGYFPRTWGAVLLVEAIVLAAVAILAARAPTSLAGLGVVGGLLGLVGWQLVSRAWAVDPDATVLEAERTLVYAGAAATAFLTVTRDRADGLVMGILVGTGVVTIGGLAEHVVGPGSPNDRLEAPVGYPNASGILAATTLLLGLGLSAEAAPRRRALAAGLAAPAAAALYLSLSRGSLIAAAIGVVLLAVTTGRTVALGRVALVALPAGGAFLLAAQVGELDAPGASLGEIAFLLALVGLALAAAVLAVATPRIPVPHVSRNAGFALGAAAAVLAVVALAYLGAREIREARSTPAAQQGAPERLLSGSTSSRSEYWGVAGGMVEDAPLLGEGAGGFTRIWLRDRPALLFVKDAHNLYLETLAELGPVGLAVLLVVLLSPLARARRAAGHPAGRAALAAYVALLAHAAIDWDWELPAVTLATVFLGVAVVQLGGRGDTLPLTPAARGAILAGAALIGAVAIVAHAGNGATAEAHEALDRGDASTAVRQADRARRFVPWAAEPWQLLGEAELAAGRVEPGRRHLRRATREDPRSWSAWLSLAAASRGVERERALERASGLNPLAPELETLASAARNP